MLLTSTRRKHAISRRRPSSRRKGELGASLVEYAFVLIVFLTLIFAVNGFGHALFVYHHLDHVTREATRYASVRGYNCDKGETVPSCQASNSASGIAGPTTEADVTAYVASITPPSIDSSKFTVTICGVKLGTVCSASTAPACKGGDPLFKAINYPSCTTSVQVQYTYKFIFPLIGTIPINMSSTSEMTIVH
jgi:Flp pilus assembly protein TadG